MFRTTIIALLIFSTFSASAQVLPLEDFSPYNEQFRRLKVESVIDSAGSSVTRTSYDKLGRIIKKEEHGETTSIQHFHYQQRGDTLFRMRTSNGSKQPEEIVRYVFNKGKRLVEWYEFYMEQPDKPDGLPNWSGSARRFFYDDNGRLATRLDYSWIDVKLSRMPDLHLHPALWELKYLYRYTYDAKGKLKARWEHLNRYTYHERDSVSYDRQNRPETIVRRIDHLILGEWGIMDYIAKWEIKYWGNEKMTTYSQHHLNPTGQFIEIDYTKVVKEELSGPHGLPSRKTEGSTKKITWTNQYRYTFSPR
ncbi:hypothetical protein [Chitinophaga caseinilytica]|uniref:hypothetical protein n=1 Tax=Chitinophaga caseinilytica TaxID=2267521 RepID=UPI003C302CDD